LLYLCGDQRTDIFGQLLCHTVFSATQPTKTQKSVPVILMVECDMFVFHIAFTSVYNSWADNLTIFMCRLSRNLGASNSCNPKGLYRDCFLIRQVGVKDKYASRNKVSPWKLHSEVLSNSNPKKVLIPQTIAKIKISNLM
jgi:hypothetical protein